MVNRLTSLAALQGQAFSGLQPVEPELVSPADATGLVLAADIVNPWPVPRHAEALRPGYAVTSLDLVGASAHTPVLLTAQPARVGTGSALPEGCDAVLDPDAVTGAAPLFEITECPAPGTSVRLPGHDLAEGAVLARGGVQVTPEIALSCILAGLEAIPVRCPRVRVDMRDTALRGWLAARLAALGCRIVGAGEPAALVIGDALAQSPRLALQPGEASWISDAPGLPLRIEVTRRFDGLLAAHVALILPTLAILLGQKLARAPHLVSRKISSTIGATDVVLLVRENDRLVPRARGDITLAAFAEAEYAALIPPGDEGIDAGARLAAFPLSRPLMAPDVKLCEIPGDD